MALVGTWKGDIFFLPLPDFATASMDFHPRARIGNYILELSNSPMEPFDKKRKL